MKTLTIALTLVAALSSERCGGVSPVERELRDGKVQTETWTPEPITPDDQPEDIVP